MAKLSLNEVKTAVASIVTTAKLSSDTFSVTRDNIVGLVDKIGKIVVLDTVYAIDKLAFMDGEYMGTAKTIEEWQQDLIMPVAKDPTGANALAPHSPTYRPAFYSYTIGEKVIATTLFNNNIERAVSNEGELVSIVAMATKRMQDSMAVYRYQVKREIIAKFIALCAEAESSTNHTAFASLTSSSKSGTMVYSSNKFGILVKDWPSSSAPASWDLAVAGGYIIPYALITEIDTPVDDVTGEAFIEQVKKDVEVASDLSEGHSLNGNTLGAVEGLVLVVKQGVMPSIEVNTLAGAFHLDKVAIPCEVVTIKDFGGADAGYFAVLCDKRAMRLHNTYRAVRENMNGEGDFLNLFDHTEDTAYVSRNAFVKVYKDA